LNLFTTEPRPLDAVLSACKENGVTAIGLFRPPHIEPLGFPEARGLVAKSGLQVAVYATLGFWVVPGRPVLTLEEKVALLDEAVELGAPVVSAISGAPGEDLPAARSQIIESLRELAPFAAERNIKLSIEPIHPIHGRRVFYTLGQALDICDEVDHPSVGVIVDTFHQWWEIDLVEQLRRGVESNRISLVQLADWSQQNTASKPFCRAVMGEGDVDFGLFVEGLKGYEGVFDVEILRNDELAALPMSDLIEVVADAFENTMGRFFG
jgi:sugar phosphate isomerase/epimerase